MGRGALETRTPAAGTGRGSPVEGLHGASNSHGIAGGRSPDEDVFVERAEGVEHRLHLGFVGLRLGEKRPFVGGGPRLAGDHAQAEAEEKHQQKSAGGVPGQLPRVRNATVVSAFGTANLAAALKVVVAGGASPSPRSTLG